MDYFVVYSVFSVSLMLMPFLNFTESTNWSIHPRKL